MLKGIAIFLLALSYTSLAALLVLATRELCKTDLRKYVWASELNDLFRYSKKVVLWVKRLCIPVRSKQDSNIEAALALENVKKLQLCVSVVKPMSWVAAAMLAFTLVRYHTLQLDEVEFFRSRPALPLYLIVTLTGVVHKLNPDFLSYERLVFAFFLQCVCFIQAMAVSEDYMTFQARRISTVGCRLVHAAVVVHGPCIALENVLAIVSTMTLSMRFASEFPDCASSSGREDFMNDLVVEISAACCACFVHNCMARLFKSESIAIVEAKAAQQTASTCRALLSRLCDAVLFLGPDLSLQEPSPHLAALLLKDASPDYFRGQKITDLVVDEDHERVERELSMNTVSAFTACMVDSSMNRIETQIFHVPFTDADDHVCHLLGICERSKEEVIQSLSCMTPDAVEDSLRNELVRTEDHSSWQRKRRRKMHGLNKGTRSDLEAVSIHSCSASSGSDHSSCDAYQVSFEVKVPTYKIEHSTPELDFMVGKNASGHCLSDFLQKQDNDFFDRAVQDVMQRKDRGCLACVGTFRFLPTTVLTHGFKARCCMLEVRPDVLAVSLDQFTACSISSEDDCEHLRTSIEL